MYIFLYILNFLNIIFTLYFKIILIFGYSHTQKYFTLDYDSTQNTTQNEFRHLKYLFVIIVYNVTQL